jgi:hypothetical protein
MGKRKNALDDIETLFAEVLWVMVARGDLALEMSLRMFDCSANNLGLPGESASNYRDAI